ncbi:MAG: hypothetical protein P4L86_18920 [Mycobacterium sp.]|nr:hypothetical protein [Mycobacterium sp.]
MLKNRLDIRLYVESILLVTACFCLVVGGLKAIRLLVDATSNSLVVSGDWTLGPAMALLVYGPHQVWSAWMITAPAIVALGIGLAVARERVQVPRWLEVALLGYSAIVVLDSVVAAL